jgi:hypothetical protein
LWDKLFIIKNNIDEWTEQILGKAESHELTEEDRGRLKVTHPEKTGSWLPAGVTLMLPLPFASGQNNCNETMYFFHFPLKGLSTPLIAL